MRVVPLIVGKSIWQQNSCWVLANNLSISIILAQFLTARKIYQQWQNQTITMHRTAFLLQSKSQGAFFLFLMKFVLHPVWKSKSDIRGVYLCLIFEISIWEFITNSNKNWFQIKLVFFFEFELDFYCLCSL